MSEGLVVIAYDGSPAAANAVRVAARLLGARRVVVATIWEEGMAVSTVVPSTEFGMSPGPLDVETALEVDEAVQAHAQRVAAEGAQLARSLGLDAEPVAVADEVNVAETLFHVATERDAELLVVGSRGLTGLRSRLLGSTSRAVLRHAHLPVLVVPQHGPDDD
jgi:nucleotide-binding universal stress UspA family protein